LQCLQVKKSLSETAPVSSFHFLKQEQKSRGVLSYYTKFSSTLQRDTQTGRNTHRKKEDDDQRTDSTLKNPTPSPHHQVLILSHTGVLRASDFR
jgi:hypothetical protein